MRKSGKRVSRKRMSRKRISRKRKKQTSRKKLYKMHQSYSDTYDISRRFLNAINTCILCFNFF